MVETDKKTRIMQAAEELFGARQFHEVTVDAVAQRAEVGKGTVYQYFTDKDDLFFQTAVSGLDEMCEQLRSGDDARASIRDSLYRACIRIDEFFGTRRPLIKMIQTEGDRAHVRGGNLRQQWRIRRSRLTKTVAQIISRGVSSGDIRHDIPTEVLAEYLLGMMRARNAELGHLAERERDIRSLIDMFMNGAISRRRQQGKTDRTTSAG